MKAINALILPAVCLSLGACSISVSDDGIDRNYSRGDYNDSVTVTLPNGDRDRFNCPDGTTSFVINLKDEGVGMAYGCRTNGTPMPRIDGDR